MLRNRMLVLVGGCLLTASAAWADGVAYVDCASHPEDTQVFGKPRRTPDVVASLACGERFTILQYGFIFSRIQTKDGKVGYVYSNLISADHSGASVPQPSATQPAGTSNVPANVPATPPIPATTPTAAQPNPASPAQANPTVPSQPQAMAAGSAPTQTAAATSNPSSAATAAATVAKPDAATSATPVTSSTTSSTASSTTSAQSQSTPAQAAPNQVPTASTSAPETSATIAQPSPTTPAQTQEVPDHLAITETAAPTARVETPATAAQPEATPAAQPEAAPAEPAAPAVRPVKAESWEKPNAGVRTVGLRRLPLIELFGGYGFARLDNGGGTANNLNGVVGSFGWNVRPWLQLVADSSYSVVTGTGIKDVLYGNHYGPRVFLRRRSRWGATPFVEGLVGGSRADTTITGTGGYTTSANSFSFKLGGGVDIKPSRRFEIRLFDADYYRTSFGTNLHQNNYWVSTGIVLRFFGGSE